MYLNKVLSSVFVIIFITVSCGNDKPNAVDEESVQSDFILSSTNKIVYTLPNPYFVTKCLTTPDVKFDVNILNSIKNVNNYENSYCMALNLGIYSADLIYSAFYEHKQITLQYISAVKLLAEELDFYDYIDQADIIKLEDNIYNIDSIKKLADEIFLSSNKILNDNNRPEIVLPIEVGAWIESMYITLQLSKQSKTINKVLLEQLSSQHETLLILIKLLKHFSEIEQINKIYFQMSKINKVYNKIFNNKTIGQKITPELCMSLYLEINNLRDKYIKSYYRLQ